MEIKSFKDLKVWQQSIELAVRAYEVTTCFPKHELFGLTSQIRRASSSLAANIAEGWGREGTKEFIQFLGQAQGSLNELETHLTLAQRLRYIDNHATSELCSRIEAGSKMLYSLIHSLQKKMALRKL